VKRIGQGSSVLMVPRLMEIGEGVSILSTSYSLEKNTGSGGGFISFRDQSIERV